METGPSIRTEDMMYRLIYSPPTTSPDADLVGGITLGVLAVGSTAPGLLQFAIDKFSLVFPDYYERVVRHEAGHFLAGYLMGVPVTGYGLAIGTEHTEFAEAKIQKRLIERVRSPRVITLLVSV